MLDFFKNLKTAHRPVVAEANQAHKKPESCEDADGTVMFGSSGCGLSVPIDADPPTAPISSIPLASSVASQAKLVNHLDVSEKQKPEKKRPKIAISMRN